MALIAVGAGSTVGDMQAAYPAESVLPEGTQVQLSLSLRSRVGMHNLAEVVNWAAPRYGLRPWSGSTPFASADPSRPVLHLRWTKGSIGLPLIVAALSGGTALAAILGVIDLPEFIVTALILVAVLLLAGWVLYRVVVKPLIAAVGAYWPWIVGGGAATAIGAALVVRATRRTPPLFRPPEAES